MAERVAIRSRDIGEGIREKIDSLISRLTGEPWRVCRETLRSNGSVRLMRKLTEELREKGDSSAFLEEGRFAWGYGLRLWWREVPGYGGTTFFRFPEARAVAIFAFPNREVTVNFSSQVEVLIPPTIGSPLGFVRYQSEREESLEAQVRSTMTHAELGIPFDNFPLSGNVREGRLNVVANRWPYWRTLF